MSEVKPAGTESALGGQHGPFHMIDLPLSAMENKTSVRIWAVQGSEKTALIDSGVHARYGRVVQALADIGIGRDLNYLLLTHEHMDHVGNNAALVRDTGCTVMTHPLRADRIADNVLNAETIVHAFPDVEPYFDIKPEYLDWMGPEAAKVDEFITEGDVVDLGDIRIEVIEVVGHSMAEIAFYHDDSKTLVLGDPLMPAYDLVLNLYEDPNVMQATHRKIINMIRDRNIATVLNAHHHPLPASDAVAWAEECHERVAKIGETILATIRANPGIEFGALRDSVCDAWDKLKEWRALVTINGHLGDFENRGVIRKSGSGWEHV